MPRFEICCKPGDIFYAINPNTSPRKVHRYEVISILITNEAIINCDDGGMLMMQFPEEIFKRIMHRTPELATEPPRWEYHILKLPITETFAEEAND